MKEVVLIQLNQMNAERSATNRIQSPKKYVPKTNTTGSVPSSCSTASKQTTHSPVDPAHVYDRFTIAAAREVFGSGSLRS